MILSYEHAELKRKYLAEEIAGLPVGHEVLLHGKYPGVRITEWPGRPEMRGRRIVSSRAEAQEFSKLNNRRLVLAEELTEVEGYLQYHSAGREVQDAWMDRGFYELCVNCKDSNPKPKPSYAPELDGTRFRSKSEMNIAQLIKGLGYEYVYETEFGVTDDISVYPDFTVWVPELGRCFFLEHFGLVDKQDYRTDMVWKINMYIDCTILPGKDIIFSFESDKLPLDIDVVREQINALIMANTVQKK